MKIVRYAAMAVLASFAFRAHADDRVDCLEESSKYLIVQKIVTADEMYLLVKPGPHLGHEVPCKYDVQDGDFEIKIDWSYSVYPLQGNFLVLEDGTGPDIRGLSVWDLKAKKEVYTTGYAEPLDVEKGYLRFWLETAEATDENCPKRAEWEAEGLGAAIETHVRLRLADQSVVRSSETRCRPRQ